MSFGRSLRDLGVERARLWEAGSARLTADLARSRSKVAGRRDVIAAVFVLVAACDAHAPPHGVEETCVAACEAKAAGCMSAECRSGCNLVVDRLVEGETSAVLRCVVTHSESCGAQVWAHCAAWVGPHADGGPPAPPSAEIEPE